MMCSTSYLNDRLMSNIYSIYLILSFRCIVCPFRLMFGKSAFPMDLFKELHITHVLAGFALEPILHHLVSSAVFSAYSSTIHVHQPPFHGCEYHLQMCVSFLMPERLLLLYVIRHGLLRRILWQPRVYTPRFSIQFESLSTPSINTTVFHPTNLRFDSTLTSTGNQYCIIFAFVCILYVPVLRLLSYFGMHH